MAIGGNYQTPTYGEVPMLVSVEHLFDESDGREVRLPLTSKINNRGICRLDHQKSLSSSLP